MAFAVDLTGSILDRRYRITGLLGKGGMGHVYEAVHVALDQRVAVKVLHPRYAYEERFRERFLQEARAASKIKHPNVVEIKDFGDTPDGSVYFAMEYLHGHDVGDELKRHGTLPWSRTRSILVQAASALHAAHAKHIVHRDIKPGNCFLIEDEDAGVVDLVKLLDFGIAKVGSDSHADAQGKGLTGTGEVFGTAAYMSPEQARGETLDARSDMYSLGIMAYEMLVGQVPFTGMNAIHVITQHMVGKPEPLRSHDGSIPPVVEALVLKMMAKERGDRFASMAEVEQALRELPEEVQRKTRLWSSPGELRGMIAEKRGAGAGAGVLPPVTDSGVTSPAGVGVKKSVGRGVDPERTEKVASKKEVAGVGGGKRTVVSAERPAVGASTTPVRAAGIGAASPVSPATAVVPGAAAGEGEGTAVAAVLPVVVGAVGSSVVGAAVAAPFGAAAAVAPTMSPPHGVQAPVGAWGPTGRRDGTNPPPGAEDSSAAPSAWPTNTASTGPHGRHGDTGTETYPHSLQQGQARGVTGRFAVLVLVLVILVGGVSALGTMMVLSEGDSTPSETAVSTPSAADGQPAEASPQNEPALAPTPTKPTKEDALVGGSTSSAVDETTGQPEPADAEPAESDSAGEEQAEEEPPSSRSEPAAPRVPSHETAKCIKVREQVVVAFNARNWSETAKLASQKKCWASSEQEARRGVLVRALLEGKRFEECVKVGRAAVEPKTVKLVEICKGQVK